MISVRNLVLACIFAKVAGLTVAFSIFGLDGDDDLLMLLAYTVSFSVLLSIISLSLKLSPKDVLTLKFFNRPKTGSTLLWALVAIPIGFLIQFGNGGFTLGYMAITDLNEAHEAVSSFTQKNSSLSIIVLLSTIIGAIDEEFLYRKMLLGRFSMWLGFFPALTVVGLIFGAIHYGNPLSAIIAGISFSLVYVVSGRLWVTIVAHASANLFPDLLQIVLHSLGNNISFNAILTLNIIGSILLLILLGYWSLILYKSKDKIVNNQLKVQLKN